MQATECGIGLSHAARGGLQGKRSLHELHACLATTIRIIVANPLLA
jgi:hypothetical protein